MTCRTLLPTTVLLVCLPGFGQLIPGIGFPGGGRRYPQGGRGGQTAGRQADNSLKVGMLRKIDDNDVILETDDDHSVFTIVTSGSTKYQNASGGAAKIGDFQPGDHVSVNTTQDSKKAYHAKTMNMVREGTPEEHATASAATNDTSRPIGKPAESDSGSSPTPASVSRNGAPTLRRAPGSSSSGSNDSSDTASSAPPRSATPVNDGDRPVLRRATSSSSNSDSSSTSGSAAAPPTLARPADTNPDPPRLRRASQADSGAPAAIPDPPPVAEVRPSLHSDESNTIRRMPPAEPSAEDPFIEQARDAAFAFSETLPNYIVKQYTTRYATVAARGNRTNWQALDNVTADVIQEGGVEKYKNILINGKPPVRDVEKSGSWSRGEFSSMMQDVLSPITNADFHGRRSVTMVNRAAVRYDFSVEQPNSHWHIEVEGGAYMPGYTGTIWFDKENYRVLRIEMSAQGMPSSFALDQVEWAVDYDYVAISDGRYLLPAHSETLSCARSNNQCTRNVIEFRNYRKFTADTSITFDTDK
jgi:hypothetical protein